MVPDDGERLASLLAETDALIRHRRFDQAADRARDASVLAPLDPRPYREWSRALYGGGRHREAAEMATEAIRLAPSTALGFRLRATALSTLARTDPPDRRQVSLDAVAAAQEAVRLAPTEANGYIGLAQALPLVGALGEADVAAHEAIRLAPDRASTWVAASLVALSARDWGAAVDAARRALAIEPDNHAALNNLGVALRASGHRRQGNEALARAARVDPQAPAAGPARSRLTLNLVRAAALVVLLPLLLVPHYGPVVYLSAAVVGMLLLPRDPDVVAGLERWTAPIARRLERRRDTPGPGT
jgi:tetratricopeptide (TPR) repeat protein